MRLSVFLTKIWTIIINFFINFFIFFSLNFLLQLYVSYILFNFAVDFEMFNHPSIFAEELPPFLDDVQCTYEELSAQYDAWLQKYPYQAALEVAKPEILERTWNNSRTMLELKVRYLNFLGDAHRFGFETNRMENLSEEDYCDIFVSVWSDAIENSFDLIVDPYDFAAYIYYYEPNPLQPWVDYYDIPNYTEET